MHRSLHQRAPEAPGKISLGEITVELVRKKIRSIRLSVRPPDGRVRMSAPIRVGLETLRRFAIGKLGWIRKHQSRLRQEPREPSRRHLDGERHFVWGKPYRLRVQETAAPPSVELTLDELVLRVRPGASARKREAVIEAWYRERLKEAAPPLIAKWQPVMGVTVGQLFTQRMRTRWGTCNTRSRSIRLNTELVRKPLACLEYIIVHEMTHLLEPSHNRRFKILMSRFMPDWTVHRQALRRPLASHPALSPEIAPTGHAGIDRE
jgi:predicted metal-dependent hydrolase